MKSRMMRQVAVLVTGSALALSFPIASSLANPGGVPNGGVGSSKPCKAKGKGVRKKQLTDLPSQGRKGKKCGFNKQDANGQLQNGQPNGPPNGPNGGPSCPDPFPGQGNGRPISDLPQQAQDARA